MTCEQISGLSTRVATIVSEVNARRYLRCSAPFRLADKFTIRLHWKNVEFSRMRSGEA